MSAVSSAQQAADGRNHWFTTTHWSVVLAAGSDACSGGREALETLCRTYWGPLYAYVRRRGYSVEDAEDITQEFFTHFVAHEAYRRADPARGRFRTFLLASLQNFLVSEWRKETSRKRGSQWVHVSWDRKSAEDLLAAEAHNDVTPERLYEKRWAMAVMERVLATLRREHAETDDAALFDRLTERLWGGDGEQSCSDLGLEFGLSEGAIKQRVHRLRERCRQLLRQEVAHTVSRPEEIDEELKYLVNILRC